MQNVALFCVFRVLFKWLLSLFHWTEEHCSLSVWFRFVLLLIFLISLSVNNFIVPFFFSLFALSVSKSRGLLSIMWLWKNCNLLLRPALEYLLSTLQVVYDLLYTYGACFWLFQEKQNFLSVLNDFPTGLADQNFFKIWHKTWSPSFCNEFKLNAFPLDLTRVVNNDGVLLWHIRFSTSSLDPRLSLLFLSLLVKAKEPGNEGSRQGTVAFVVNGTDDDTK